MGINTCPPADPANDAAPPPTLLLLSLHPPLLISSLQPPSSVLVHYKELVIFVLNSNTHGWLHALALGHTQTTAYNTLLSPPIRYYPPDFTQGRLGCSFDLQPTTILILRNNQELHRATDGQDG